MRLMYKKCVNLKYSFILKGGVGRGPKEYVSDFIMKIFFLEVLKVNFPRGFQISPSPTFLDPVITGRMLMALLEWGGDINSITVV